MTLRNTLLIAAAACGAVLAAGITFTPADYKEASAVHLPQGVQITPLFIGGYDTVTAMQAGKKVKTLSKDWNDYLAYMPINGRSDSGYVAVSHEKIEAHPVLGDGGGMTVFTIAKNKSGNWYVVNDTAKGKFRNIDFSNVGGTLANCGGMLTPWGTVVTAEEWNQANNKAILTGWGTGMNAYTGKWNDAATTGITDTSDYTIVNPFGNNPALTKTVKKFQNFNWMVEADMATGMAKHKLYSMGRFEHEGGAYLNDTTVYLTDDFTPGLLFKFISDSKTDWRSGKLFAFKQNDTAGKAGSWVRIPQDLDSLMDARTVALKKGATAFIRLEWIVEKGGKIYFTETGRDAAGAGLTSALRAGGTLAHHHFAWSTKGPDGKLLQVNGKDTVIRADVYGRVLQLDPKTDVVSVLVDGGMRKDASTFSNPDGLAQATIGGKDYLMIQEDLNGQTLQRVSDDAAASKQDISDVWLLELGKDKYTADDLVRLAVGPMGAETTGGFATPDGKTLFFNIQHPTQGRIDWVDTKTGESKILGNQFPYDHSVTVALTGHDAPVVTPVQMKNGDLTAQYLPVTQQLVFGREVTARLFDAKGRALLALEKGRSMNLMTLGKGTFYVKTAEGQVFQLVR
jgi:secreted PhoX family phosphatase